MNIEQKMAPGGRWVLAAAIVMLIVGSFYYFVYRPVVAEFTNLEQQFAEDREFLQKTEAIVLARRAAVAGEQASSDTAKRDAAVPAIPGQEAILLELQLTAAATGVKLEEVVFEEPTIPAPSGTEVEGFALERFDLISPFSTGDGVSSDLSAAVAGTKLPDDEVIGMAGISAVRIQVNLRGAAATVKAFSKGLQQTERLYIVRSFTYGTDAAGKETSSLGLVAFYREQSQ